MTLIEQLNEVIIAIAKDISNNSGGSGSTDNSDITVLLPRKIGASQKWYQSGLRYDAEYPYPYVRSMAFVNNGWQYFVPFTALEDATITALEVFCSTQQSDASASVSLGIYASDVNNDISYPLFTSNPIDCSETGAKDATCNVHITKGNVYWLSSLTIGYPVAFYSNSDSLKPVKGNALVSQPPIVGYFTNNNSSMAQSYPTNKFDLATKAPRVVFITG